MGSDQCIYAVYESETLYLFEDIESVQLASVSCVKGVALDVGKDNWRTGLTFYLPVDRITRIIEYDSLEHFKKVIADFHHKKADI